MNRFSLLFTILMTVCFVFSVAAQDRFDRVVTIEADTLDVGGWGNLVAGDANNDPLDIDGDGNNEIYAINTDWHDAIGLDLIPRIYKYEEDGNGGWVTAWSTRLPLNFQNTWGALAVGDLDEDGRDEVVWGIVNNTGSGLQPNPERIAVFETAGDGSDVMGVANGDGTYRPNAQWTITDLDNQNIRPFRWLLHDIDGDGVTEIVAGCRAGDGIQVYSVDDIPDAADSTETWALEFSGVSETFYDIAILDDVIYGIDDDGDVHKVFFDATGDDFVVGATQDDIAGAGAWNSAAVVDIDGDEQDEIILASWSSSNNDVYLLEYDATGDSLISTMIADVPGASFRSYGGAAGDFDGDGNLDFTFGTRQSTPNAIIHRIEYQGGLINDPGNWVLSVMDQEVADPQQYDIFDAADLDDDGEDEVVYTGTVRGKLQADPPQPIVILDRIPVNQPIISGVADVPNDQGRYVWVIWKGSQEDAVPDLRIDPDAPTPIAVFAPKNVEFPFTTYMGRDLKPMRVNPDAVQPNQVGTITNYVVWRIDGGSLPVQVNSTVAIQSEMYAAVVPTLGDGEDWEGTYVVSAHTATPSVNWKSFPKSGMSEDNLAPFAPTGVIAAQTTEGQIDLAWDEAVDEDVNYYSIRRGTEPDFDAGSASEIATTADLFYFDTDVEGGNTYYYRIAAFDFFGNEGDLSEEVFLMVTGLEDAANALPKSFAVHANYPNPFNPSTTIRFDLPKQVDVQITIYNALGSKIRSLVNDYRSAGTHTVVWDGTNDSGMQVATGVYLYVVRAGTFVEAKKMTLMK